jgi:DNA helicase-2/ATP-dependent DNA helicase PcrA
MDFRDTALDELSVFYVGVTRAKSQVFVSASAKRLDYYGKEKNSSFSCMAALEGIKLVKADS